MSEQIVAMVRRKGVVRARELTSAGFHPEAVRRLVAGGLLERVSRGVYRVPTAEAGRHHDLAVVARRVPAGVICLLSALRYHDLGSQSPGEVWVAVDRRAAKPRVEVPSIRVVRFSGAALQFGVKSSSVEGVNVRVYSPAKTVADCFKYRNKIGLDVAIEALRAALHDRKAAVAEIFAAARVCRVANVIRPYVEATV